jgi:hypothetical protein
MGQLAIALPAKLIDECSLFSIAMAENVGTYFAIAAIVPASYLLAFQDSLMK